MVETSMGGGGGCALPDEIQVDEDDARNLSGGDSTPKKSNLQVCLGVSNTTEREGVRGWGKSTESKNDVVEDYGHELREGP